MSEVIKVGTPTEMWRSSPERWEDPHPCEIKGCATGSERTICDDHHEQYLVGSMN